MGNPKRFAAVNTKIRSLERKFMTEEDFINIMNKKNTEEIFLYLRDNTEYRDVLENLDGSKIHRPDLEREIKVHIFVQFRKIVKYFDESYKKLFQILLMKYEIEDLKFYLRKLLRNEKLTFRVNEYGDLDYEKLSNAKDINKFVEELRDTEYYKALKPYLGEKNKKLLFYMVISLDKLYFSKIKEQGLKLSKEDSKKLFETIGRNIDLLNIEWIYRGLKYYDLFPEELINYTLPEGYRLKYNDIKKLCYADDLKEFQQIILNTEYSFLFDTKKDVDLFMERRIERYLYFKFISLIKASRMDITVSLAYFYLLEYEVKDIFSIVEGIEYNLSFDEMKEYLIRRIKGSGK
ncbi:MAG: hypothetical protein E7205_06835 [Tissierellaceae bacterium]|nr:hypothetical protein [Tissierellaceae bacterium]